MRTGARPVNTPHTWSCYYTQICCGLRKAPIWNTTNSCCRLAIRWEYSKYEKSFFCFQHCHLKKLKPTFEVEQFSLRICQKTDSSAALPSFLCSRCLMLRTFWNAGRQLGYFYSARKQKLERTCKHKTQLYSHPEKSYLNCLDKVINEERARAIEN